MRLEGITSSMTTDDWPQRNVESSEPSEQIIAESLYISEESLRFIFFLFDSLHSFVEVFTIFWSSHSRSVEQTSSRQSDALLIWRLTCKGHD